tara:strand:- start:123305 stop:123463 length:159 start_codon:yes stop_codon:yes gene_type:complete
VAQLHGLLRITLKIDPALPLLNKDQGKHFALHLIHRRIGPKWIIFNRLRLTG